MAEILYFTKRARENAQLVGTFEHHSDNGKMGM